MRFAGHRTKLRIMLFRTLVDAGTLQALLGTPQLPGTPQPALIDCRFDLMRPEAGRQAYLEAHIPGARYADLNRDLSAPVGAHTGRHPLPSPAAFAAALTRLGIGNDSQVIAYDDANGSFAARLWWMLRWVGHDAVAVLDGGFQAWRKRGGPLQSGEPAPAAAGGRNFTPRPGAVENSAALGANAVLVTTADLEQLLFEAAPGAPKPLLVDARATERFAGTVEPIDSVAGHIPGAVNHPFADNLAADHRFLPAAELKARWLERLAGTAPENLIAMCGSGVTACHNLLSLEVAGLPGAKLYAGSWSEWIRDPRRPVARS
jgi:thiosulfate/3-mercaptopyruvate sulfurtransferase